MRRTARCACDRVQVTVEGELSSCSSVIATSAKTLGERLHCFRTLAAEQVADIVGEATVYNGLEVDGMGAVGIPGGIDYHHCSICGSTVYWNSPRSESSFFAIAIGNFV